MQAAAFQYRDGLEQDGEPAPARTGCGQNESGPVRGEQGNQGEELHGAGQGRTSQPAQGPEGRSQHIEQHHGGTDRQCAVERGAHGFGKGSCKGDGLTGE